MWPSLKHLHSVNGSVKHWIRHLEVNPSAFPAPLCCSPKLYGLSKLSVEQHLIQKFCYLAKIMLATFCWLRCTHPLNPLPTSPTPRFGFWSRAGSTHEPGWLPQWCLFAGLLSNLSNSRLQLFFSSLGTEFKFLGSLLQRETNNTRILEGDKEPKTGGSGEKSYFMLGCEY